jgi:phospholipid/cholesterol/gamma-HCH transport system permease protein
MKRLIIFPLNLFISFFEGIGEYVILMASAFKALSKTRQYSHSTIDQLVIIGTNSIPIILLTAFFSGMVTTVQSGYQFTSWVPQWFVGSVVGESVLLELAPMITGLVLTGRVGATIAAELGTMRVTEQIDALESLSFDPVAFLIIPRVLAGLIMFPILIVFADIMGIMGGWITAIMSMDVSTFEFFKGFKTWFKPWDAWFGLLKALFFGFSITSIACYFGFNTKGGAEGVGKSTTITVVVSCVVILILDFVLAAVFL